jgi:hypothetical protein
MPSGYVREFHLRAHALFRTDTRQFVSDRAADAFASNSPGSCMQTSGKGN